jgi:hypothetical protein
MNLVYTKLFYNFLKFEKYLYEGNDHEEKEKDQLFFHDFSKK